VKRINDKEIIDIEKIPVVKKYFERIYSILPEDIRSKLNNLKLSKEDLDQIKRELAFLPKKKQAHYLEEWKDIYEKLTKK
jgi:hypothetical protein